MQEDTPPPEPPATQEGNLPDAGPYAILWARELVAAQAVGILQIERWQQYAVPIPLADDPTTWWWHEGMEQCLYQHPMSRVAFQLHECEIVHRRPEEFDRLMSFVRIRLSGALRLPSGASLGVRLGNVAEAKAGVDAVIVTVYEHAAK